MPKKIHTALSFSELLSSIAFRLGSVVFLFYIYPHYEDNPTVIGCLMGLAIYIILTFGAAQIIVYEDRIDQVSNSFISLFIKSKKSTLRLADIQKAYLEELPTSTATEIGVVVILQAVMPNKQSKSSVKSIYFLLKNGDVKEYYTELDRESRQQIVTIVNELIK